MSGDSGIPEVRVWAINFGVRSIITSMLFVLRNMLRCALFSLTFLSNEFNHITQLFYFFYILINGSV